jgi:hypothetical protein
MLALFGKPVADFHPWFEVVEKTILDRLHHQPASLLPTLAGDRLKQEFLTEQKDLIDGLMFVLKDDSRDRSPLPAVAVSYFSNTRNLKKFVGCVAKLNAFTEIADFHIEYEADEFFGQSVGVTAALCKLLQAVCCRFPLSCTVEETMPDFFKFLEGALPMENGRIIETPVVEKSIDDDDEYAFDDTPSRSSSVDEKDPLSEMFLAALELEASLVKHGSIQVGADFAKSRLQSIMMAMYRKTTLESRVKDQILSCIPRYYNLACFSKVESQYFAAYVTQWNHLDKLLDNVPSAAVAIEFMNKMISSHQTSLEARIPFLDLTFE